MDGDRSAALAFGAVTLKDGCWFIECEAHVAVRLRRVFPRAPQVAGRSITLTANPENSRELRWFLQRFPMAVSAPEMLEQLAERHIDTELRVSDLLSARCPPPAFELAEPPRDYQSVAAALLLTRGALLLADVVGLGKTVSATCAMTQPDSLPAVVVCQPHLVRQWLASFQRFAPQLTAHGIVAGAGVYPLLRGKGSRRPGLRPDKLPDVIVVSYFMLRKWADTLAEFARYVVFDECQQLRNPDSDIYAACTLLSKACALRMGLSATPISGYGAEFFWVLDCIEPGCLGSRAEFLNDHCSNSINSARQLLADPEKFGSWLRREGLMLRRTRTDVGRELPPVSRIAHDIACDVGAIDAVRSNAVDLAKIILAENESRKGARMQAAAEFDMLLRQATGIAKAPHAADFIRLLAESGEKVVVYAWHREVIRILQERLADLTPVLFTGSESAPQKQASVEQFTNGPSQVIIISLGSGAGLDGLQLASRTAVFAELSWSPATHEQCIGRVARDGQLHPVLAYFLVTDAGTDPYMTELIGIKHHQIQGVIQPDAPLIQRAGSDEGHLRALARQFLERNA